MADRGQATTFLRAVIRAGPGLAGLALTAGLVAGTAEAVALALIVRAAIDVAGGQPQAAFDLGATAFDPSRGAALTGAAVATVVRLAAASLLAVVVARLSTRVVDELRQRLVTAFLHAPWSVQSTQVDGELQGLLAGHLARVDQSATVVAAGLGSAGTFLALTTVAVILAPGPSLVLLVGLGLVVVVSLPGLQRLAMSSGAQAAAELEVAAAGSELVRLASEVRVYGVEDQVEDRIGHRLAEAERAQEARTRARQLLPAVSYAAVLGTAIVALALTGSIDGLDLGATGGAVLIVIRALVATQPLQESWSQAREAAPFLQEVTARIAVFEKRTPVESAGRRLERLDHLGLHQVDYAYPDGTRALKGIDLEVRGGEVLGVAGPSGGGKSTLAQVLLRLRAPTAGTYVVDGTPVASVAAGDWSRLVAFVPQDPLVFDGTIEENIDFFRGLDPAAVAKAATQAGLPATEVPLDRDVGPGRGALSGGQRQRVVIARALAGGPDVVVLDEPTSALDGAAETHVLETIAALRGTVTLVVVSHRAAPLAICDRVVRLEGGRLVAAR